MDREAGRKRGCFWTAIGCVTAPLLAFILMVIVLRTTFERYRQTGRSMEPTLSEGDMAVARRPDRIKRGDLIVFYMPTGKGVAMKRVIGMPGDVVELRDNRAMVNGLLLAEPYAAPNDTSLPGNAVLRNTAPMTVEPNAYYVLGDNRDHSNDSRFYGPVQRQAVRARVVCVVSKRTGVRRP